MPPAAASLAGANPLVGSPAGLAALAWGTIELAFRLRLVLRPGPRSRPRRREPPAGPRPHEWTFAVVVAVLAAAVLLASWAAAGLRGAAIGGGVVSVIAGEVLIACGVALRVWAIVTLDRFFTFIVSIADDHRVVRQGPYRLIRHPGYAGALLALLGIGVALGNWLSVLLLLLLPPLAFAVRIRAEEATLIAALGEEYLDYARTTVGLVPGVW